MCLQKCMSLLQVRALQHVAQDYASPNRRVLSCTVALCASILAVERIYINCKGALCFYLGSDACRPEAGCCITVERHSCAATSVFVMHSSSNEPHHSATEAQQQFDAAIDCKCSSCSKMQAFCRGWCRCDKQLCGDAP